jgi:cGMP-dependent protein kinase
MAPEVMQGKGYSLEADYWSLGVLFYEFICGKLPFAEKLNNPYKIYEEVMKKQLVFPSFQKDEHAINLIKKLLNKNIQERGMGGFESIKNCGYFSGFNWQDLYEGNIVPPFIPKKFRGGEISSSGRYKEVQGYPISEYFYPKKEKENGGIGQQEF